MSYPSFADHNGNTWQVVTVHIIKSPQWQAELECQIAGIGKTKTFFFSAHTGTISQLDPTEVMCSVPNDANLLEKALISLFK